MKVMATADWHIPAAAFPALGAARFDLVLHGGDVFSIRAPPPGAQLQAINALKNFDRVVIVSGNHDSSPKTSSLSPFRALKPQNISFVDRPSVINYSDCSVVAVPWIWQRRSAKIEFAVENLVRSLLLSAKKRPVFLVAHATVMSAKYGGYRDVTIGKDIIWQESFLEGFDFCCIGHIHMPQRIGENAVYPGSVERLNFGERDEDKGFFIWEDGDISFHSLSPTPMFWFKGNINSVMEDIENAPDGSIIRATIDMESGDVLPKLNRKRFKSLDIITNFPRPERRKIGDVILEPIPALESYLEGNPRKEELLKIARSL